MRGVVTILCICFLVSCKVKYIYEHGNTMGTIFNVKYQSTTSHKKEMIALLEEINASVSTYDPESVISQFNQSKDSFFVPSNDRYFLPVFDAALSVHQSSDGYFDPTVMPLVNYWGFGYSGRNKKVEPDSMEVNALMNFIGMVNINSFDSYLLKSHPSVELDFSAIAKGYAVDLIAIMLEKEDVENYMVEIGGEVRCGGVNSKGEEWKLGISKPDESALLTDFAFMVNLDNASMATSGNYRNFYKIGGKKFHHTINPKTGYPEILSLLSATVVASDCMRADAWATAFMVMGLEDARAKVSELKNIEACFIYNDGGVLRQEYSANFEAIISTPNESISK